MTKTVHYLQFSIILPADSAAPIQRTYRIPRIPIGIANKVKTSSSLDEGFYNHDVGFPIQLPGGKRGHSTANLRETCDGHWAGIVRHSGSDGFHAL